MYIYFDSNGVIKEIVNDVAIRKGSADYNKLYVYIDGNPEIDDIWYFQKFPNGSTSNEVSFINNVVIKSIPYDAKRDMTYFKDFVQYKFYVFTLTSEYLNISGLAIGTIRIAVDGTIFALGELTFNIQANEVNADNGITQSQYNYLLLAYASRTLSEYTSRDLENYIDYIINAKVEELNPLQPSGTGTTAYITSQTSDIGILISTDNGHWYYWNGTQYADGGNYQAPFYNSSNKLDADYVDDTSSTHKFVTASEKAQIGTNATNITELQNYKADRNNSSQTIKANKITVNRVISLYDNRAYIDFEQEAGFVISTPNDDFFVNSQTGGIVGRDTYNGSYYAFRLEEGKFNITGTGIHYYENGNQMATQTYVDSTTGHTIELSLDSTNYQITAVLKNSSGTVISTSSPIDLPLESVVVSGAYDDTTKKVVLTLQNGSTIDFSVADLIDGLQPEITAQNKLSSDLVNDVNYITLSKTITSFNDVLSADASGYLTQATFDKIDENTRIDFTITATDDDISMTFRLKMIYSDVNGYAFGAYQFFEDAGVIYETMMNCNIDPTNYSYEMHFTVLQLYTKDSVDGLVKANPTLDGTESDLTGLEVKGVKYKVPSGSGGSTPHLYKHSISFQMSTYKLFLEDIYNNSSTALTVNGEIFTAINNSRNKLMCYCFDSNDTLNKITYIGHLFLSSGQVRAKIQEYNGSSEVDTSIASNPNSFTDTITQIL